MMKKVLCIIIVLSCPYLYADFNLTAPTSSASSSFGVVPTDSVIPSFFQTGSNTSVLSSSSNQPSSLSTRVTKYITSGITKGYYNPQPPFLTASEIMAQQNKSSNQTINQSYATLANYLNTTLTEQQIDGNRSQFANKADYFINMDFKIDNAKLINAIQNGIFEKVSYDRAVLSEYILGKMSVAANVFTQNNFLSNVQQSYGTIVSSKSDLQIVKDFLEASQMYLADTRFLRTLFPNPDQYSFSLAPSHSQSSSATSSSSSLLPQGGYYQQSAAANADDNKMQLLDMLGGLLILGGQNTSSNPTHVQVGFSPSGQGNQAFVPVLSAVNKWSSTSGTTRQVSYTIDNLQGTTPPLKVTIANNQLVFDPGFGQTTTFSFDDLKNFFSYPHQWAPVITIGDNGPVVKAIAKLNAWEFPLLLNKNDEQFYENQVIQMPSFLYSYCLPDKDYGIDVGPLAYNILQGLYNGFLISKPSHDWSYENYGKAFMNNERQKDCTKFKDNIAKQAPGQSYGEEAPLKFAQLWYTSSKSPIDWKLLRALKVTLAAQQKMYVTSAMLPNLITIMDNPSQASPAQTNNYKFILKAHA